jgi:hypothetical protein
MFSAHIEEKEEYSLPKNFRDLSAFRSACEYEGEDPFSLDLRNHLLARPYSLLYAFMRSSHLSSRESLYAVKEIKDILNENEKILKCGSLDCKVLMSVWEETFFCNAYLCIWIVRRCMFAEA